MVQLQISVTVMISLAVVFLATQVHSQSCGNNARGTLQGNAFGIKNATEGSWPWMVEITKVQRGSKSKYDHMCNGFLINGRHVLSSAHCFADERTKPELFKLRVGNVNRDKASEYSISQITVHEGYEPASFLNDIGILTLSKEVDTPGFAPVCLPDDRIRDMDLTGLETTYVGWQQNRAGRLIPVLQEIRGLRVISNAECNQRFEEKLKHTFRRNFPSGLSNGMMCAELPENTQTNPSGDSGSPLMLLHKDHWFAVGIITFGAGTLNTPEAYTRISYYMDWIKENTRI